MEDGQGRNSSVGTSRFCATNDDRTLSPGIATGNPGSLCVGKYREHMRRSLGLEICKKMEIKINETYHVVSCCCL